MSALLEAMERTEFQRSSLRKLRDNGKIPAVVYGSNKESKPVSISAGDLLKTIRDNGRNGIISLQLNGKRQNVILSDYQADPLKREIIHADFLTVDMSTELQVNVRIQLDGEAMGVKDGGVLQQTLHELSITTTPDQIPQAIIVDIANLQVNENLTVADISSGKNFTINHDEDEVVVTILPPKQEEEISTGEKQDAAPADNVEGRETSGNVE
jgi:large subunit ribosomal protein L25